MTKLEDIECDRVYRVAVDDYYPLTKDMLITLPLALEIFRCNRWNYSKFRENVNLDILDESGVIQFSFEYFDTKTKEFYNEERLRVLNQIRYQLLKQGYKDQIISACENLKDFFKES